ncbi:MAG: hypothetical protein XD73_0973 [Anaerolinea thermophila]|uniref:Uncharacterized protein n=1 Tax=Anaerolinea thermophila TaxID=167964 RepID=A0A117LGM4_9CHLR|nr:MAG: hypothetical protein XD73_0973 [Anaerolinea thermophila]
MNNIRKLSEKPFFLPIIALIVGLIIGLVVLGWGIWPVQWVDAAPSQLQSEFKRDYLCMVIDSYVRNHDEDLVNKRLTSLGDDAEDYVNMLTPELCKFTSQEEIESFKALKFTASTTTSNGTTLKEQAAVIEEEQTDGTKKSPILTVLLYVVGFALVGGAAFMILVKRGKINFNTNAPQKIKRGGNSDGFVEDTPVDKTSGDQYSEPPLAQFMTTFRLGDDLYDDSFSIDSPSGEFLGECGVGIAETIGVGDPKKVNALEIWLFDKNDIQTITKVLMSEHSFNDPATRQRLAAKGETILVETGQRFIMETATLQLQARIVDMVYARDALPENSHFSRLTLEISVLNKM